MPQPTRTIVRLLFAALAATLDACSSDSTMGEPELMVHDVATPEGDAGGQRSPCFVASLSEAAKTLVRIR